jgi:hypothetical protein
MTISITDEEWDELVPESFDTTALLRAVNAVDVLREDLNDREDGGPPQLRTDLLLLHQLAGQRASRCHREHRLDVGQKGDRGYAVVRVFDGKSRFAFASPVVVETPIYEGFIPKVEVHGALQGFNSFHPIGRAAAETECNT